MNSARVCEREKNYQRTYFRSRRIVIYLCMETMRCIKIAL